MFSISHTREGTFRLEIHHPPSEFSRADARRLLSILLAFARELSEPTQEDSSATPAVSLGSRARTAT